VNDAFALPQSVLVLGGTSDIARATVRALAARRARAVVLAGRDPQGLEAAATEARAAGANRVAVEAFEATEVERHSEVVQRLFVAHGPVDLVLMAVGILGDQDRDAADPEAAARVITTNFTGPAAALLAVAAQLRAQGQGTLVVLSSVAGERVRRANFVYGASKAGLDGFSQGLGDDLAASGVRVMVVRPGFVRDRMTAGRQPAPFSTTPDAVAEAIVEGLARGVDTVWVPGQLRAFMALSRHLPRALWRKVPG
jgi:decaprenylphospho-beta-D-erythro-pentofuranosid-2-ulose 2-reductase